MIPLSMTPEAEFVDSLPIQAKINGNWCPTDQEVRAGSRFNSIQEGGHQNLIRSRGHSIQRLGVGDVGPIKSPNPINPQPERVLRINPEPSQPLFGRELQYIRAQ